MYSICVISGKVRWRPLCEYWECVPNLNRVAGCDARFTTLFSSYSFLNSILYWIVVISSCGYVDIFMLRRLRRWYSNCRHDTLCRIGEEDGSGL